MNGGSSFRQLVLGLDLLMQSLLHPQEEESCFFSVSHELMS